MKITCLSVDCPERTGGRCWAELGPEIPGIVRELRALRTLYDDFERDKLIDTMEGHNCPYVTWRGWKLVRNPISDRIEQLTGSRN